LEGISLGKSEFGSQKDSAGLRDGVMSFLVDTRNIVEAEFYCNWACMSYFSFRGKNEVNYFKQDAGRAIKS